MAVYEGGAGWERFVGKMMEHRREIRSAMRDAVREATNVTHARSKELLNELVYSKPEDRTGYSYRTSKKSGKRTKYTHILDDTGGDAKLKRRDLTKLAAGDKVAGGKKKWTRTGNLRRSETRSYPSEFQGMIANDAEYALPRHDLGLPAGDPRAIHGSKRRSGRIAPWRVLAVMDTAEQRHAIFQTAIRKAMDLTD